MATKKNQSTDVKVKLTVYDRVEIPKVLPDRAGYDKAVITSNIREKVALSQADIKRVNMETKQTPEGMFSFWDMEKDLPIYFTFTELEYDSIKQWFKDLEVKKELKTDNRFIALYKKFMN